MSINNSIKIGVKITAPPTLIAYSDNHARNVWEMHAERERTSGNAIDYFIIRSHESAHPSLLFTDNSVPHSIKAGDIVEITGEVRSRDSLNRKRRLQHIYADKIEFADSTEKNAVQLCGYICTKINTYKNPRSGRKHASCKINVKSNNGRYQYINIVALRDLADVLEKMHIGKLVAINGLLQYREYTKIHDGEIRVRAVYEVTAKSIKELNEENKHE